MIVYFVSRMKSRNLIGKDEVSKVVFCTEHGNCYAIEKTDNDFISFSSGFFARDGVLDNPEPNVMKFMKFQDIIYKSFTNGKDMELFARTLENLVGNPKRIGDELIVGDKDLGEFSSFFQRPQKRNDFGNVYVNIFRDRCWKCIELFADKMNGSRKKFIVRMKRQFLPFEVNTFQIATKSLKDGAYAIEDEFGRAISVPQDALEF